MSTRPTRRSSFSRGVKAGAVKNSIDKAISPISSPVVEAIRTKLQEIHPNTELASGMVEGIIKCALIMGFAEILDVAIPALDNHTKVPVQKMELASEFMREYAGEKVGHEVVELAAQFAPIIMAAFADFNTEDLQHALPEHSVVAGEPIPEELTNVAASLAIEEEEQEEVQVAVPAPAKKVRVGKPRKKKAVASA